MLIALDGNQVFTSESFDLTMARKLELLMAGAQSSGNLQTAKYGRYAGTLGGDGQPHRPVWSDAVWTYALISAPFILNWDVNHRKIRLPLEARRS